MQVLAVGSSSTSGAGVHKHSKETRGDMGGALIASVTVIYLEAIIGRFTYNQGSISVEERLYLSAFNILTPYLYY